MTDAQWWNEMAQAMSAFRNGQIAARGGNDDHSAIDAIT
jgi:hypothetical protein